MNPSQVLQEWETWPLDQQLELMHAMWDRLGIGWEPEVTDELKAELDRRMEDLVKHPEKALTLEEVLKRVKEP
jgi:putative addiction module component (TIGR02574 family)